jgi:hypothetical protein
MADNLAQTFPAASSERRGAARRRTLRRARVVVNNSYSTFDALVRDVSEGGAQLKLPTAWALPTEFELQILTPLGTVETIVPCQKKWQSGDHLGAQFVAP